MGYARENTETADIITQNPGMTPGEITDLEGVRRAMNARWDGYTETLISRNKLALKQTATLLQALLAKCMGGGIHEFIVAAPTEAFVGTWKLNGYEMLNKSIFGSDWNPGSAISYGVHEEPDGNLRWGATKQHYLMFTRKDIWLRRQQQIEAENEENMRRHVPDRQTIDMANVKPNQEVTGSEVTREIVRTRSKSAIQGKRGPGRPRKE